jgi:hypothetical protein
LNAHIMFWNPESGWAFLEAPRVWAKGASGQI